MKPRYRSRKRKFAKYVVIFFLPLIFGATSYFFFDDITGYFVREQPLLPKDENLGSGNFTLLDEDPLSTIDYLPVDVEVVAGGILLSNNCSGVYIAMSNQKTFSIKRGLENTLDIRPNYHDTTYDIITHYNVNITMAKISRMKNNFYYADVYLEKEGDLLHLDSRPSDALALAARFDAPVYVHESVFKRQRINICEA